MQAISIARLVLTVSGLLGLVGAAWSAEPTEVPRFHVHELTFEGPVATVVDSPARDVELSTLWKHESGDGELTVWGFWDGDGEGGATGGVYKVRLSPPSAGIWTLTRTRSNRPELDGQREGYRIRCTASSHPGFWVPDPETDGRWYRRSDGSHPYIVGDTLYSFLSEVGKDGPTGGTIRDDVEGTSQYFKKIRFSISGDRYPHPRVKPFLDQTGAPSDDGRYSHRPNPEWFLRRVDLAVATAFEHDLIADLILNGPDTRESRSILKAERNDGDATPLLRYIAARYGSYPNVWICLANEFDIKNPSYSPAEIVAFGETLRGFLPHPTPLSVHSKPRDWYDELNRRPWNDHVILQKKLKKLPEAADWIARNHAIGGRKPVIDDELAYEGAGDGWSEDDVIESHLGALLGGGYGTTGHKPASKEGHYFWGHFKAEEHRAADNLRWLREQIDKQVTSWRMAPAEPPQKDASRTSIFANVSPEFRALEWEGQEYVLGTNQARRKIHASLPEGTWTVVLYDVCAMTRTVLAEDARGTLELDAPDSRAAFVHVAKRR